MDDLSFAYDNRTGRPPGRFVAWAGRVLPGVARVQADAEPFADAWRAHNLSVIREPQRLSRARWVVLGDSMSQSLGASAWNAGWVHQAAHQLAAGRRHLDIINLSATGARVGDVLDQQLPAYRSLAAESPTAAQPDLVTVLVGSNDLFARGFRDDLPARFAELIASLPQGAIVAALPQPRPQAQAANTHLDAAVAAGRLRLADLRTEGPQSWRGKLAADKFHPNDAGYAAIAAPFVGQLKAAYDRF